MNPRPILISGALIVAWLALRTYWRQILWRGTPLVAMAAIIGAFDLRSVVVGYFATFAMWMIAAVYGVGCLRVLVLGERQFGADDRIVFVALLFALGFALAVPIGMVVIAAVFGSLPPWWLGTVLTFTGYVAWLDLLLRAALIPTAAVVGIRVATAQAWHLMQGQSWRLLGALLMVAGPFMAMGYGVRAMTGSRIAVAAIDAASMLVETPLLAGIMAYALRQRLGHPMRGLGES